MHAQTSRWHFAPFHKTGLEASVQRTRLQTSMGEHAVLWPGHSAPPLGMLIACSLTTSYHPFQLRGSHIPEDSGGQLCELGQAPLLGSLDMSGGHSSCLPRGLRTSRE